MRYISTLLAVTDLLKSRRFYQDILGLEVVSDFGANIVLTGGIALQTMETWTDFIHQKPVTLGHHAGELYFEESDLDTFLEKLDQAQVCLVHPLKEHRWGQRVVRFYDPDGHIIEVGEDMGTVVRRFAKSGMTPEQVAMRMDVPLEYVQTHLSEK